MYVFNPHLIPVFLTCLLSTYRPFSLLYLKLRRNHHHIIPTTRTMSIKISISTQIKMALHATKYSYSTPIHGIILGKRSEGSDSSLHIVDAVPVCHEVPTKPIVDMALRLVDAHLRNEKEEGLKIVGWYTANANTTSSTNNNNNNEQFVEKEEVPNSSACRIISSIAQCYNSSEGGDNGNESDDFVLLLISTSQLIEQTLPICSVFEKDNNKSNNNTFTKKVDMERIDSVESSSALSYAMEQCLLNNDAKAGVTVYDFVDHLENGGRGDWIENDMVNKIVMCRKWK